MSVHSKQTAAKGNHGIVAYVFANAADRGSFSNEVNSKPAPTADDAAARKIALQQSDGSLWVLTNHSPVTWVALVGGSVVITDSRYWKAAAGRNQNATNIYLRHQQNIPMNISPAILPFDATLIAISASSQTAATWVAEVHEDGSLVTGAVLNISAADSGFRNDLAIDFSAGDKVQLFCSGSAVPGPHVEAVFRRR
jgi:hypothetical protein